MQVTKYNQLVLLEGGYYSPDQTIDFFIKKSTSDTDADNSGWEDDAN